MRIAGGTAKRITKRIINFILVIWGVVTLSFCLQVFTGTDPAEMIVRKVNVFATEEQIQAVREELGLDAPFPATLEPQSQTASRSSKISKMPFL